MRQFFRRLFKVVAYSAAGFVILLAVAVGLFRLFLPRLPEYQESIKDWASAAIGMEVEFSGMDARWGLRGPELAFYNTEIIRPDTRTRVVAAEEIRIGVALARLILEGEGVVDRVVIKKSSVELRRLSDGGWWLQGAAADDWLALRKSGTPGSADVEVIVEAVEVVFLQPGDEKPRFFTVRRASVDIDQNRLAVDADIRLPADLGSDLGVSATQMFDRPAQQRRWDLKFEADDVDLAGWSRLQKSADPQFLSGTGSVDLAMTVAQGGVKGASADIDFADVALVGERSFDVAGRFEFSAAPDGWLLAAENFRLTTNDHAWPETTVRAEVSTDADGKAELVDVRASYLRLQDAALFSRLLNAEQQQQLNEFDPTGIVTNLVATVSEIDSEAPRFDIAAELERVGLTASGSRPGFSGFSGVLRANRLGGRVEIRSTDMLLDLPDYLPQAIDIDAADGTIIWRSSDTNTTVLSDSIRIRNAVFDSESNVQLIMGSGDASPEIDLASTWRIADIAVAKKYIPKKVIKPKLYNWFQAALVSGSIPQGTTSLKGPLDKFPFDGGEGRFLIEASLRDLTFKYQPRWPATERSDMEVVLDNMRLYSISNRSLSAGNQTIDAKIEIADLRNPVLTIDASSTGTLETLRAFSRQSPIGDFFGGQLDRIQVSGDASFTLDLTVPLKQPDNFSFTSRLRSDKGTLAIDGFAPPVTDLSGVLTISRDSVIAESLKARFLGESITVDLGLSDDPKYSVVATTRGSVTADAIIAELGVPLSGLISGATKYETRILFPRREQETPSPLTIQIESNLSGLGIRLPQPVDKVADSALGINGDIRFLPDGNVIESAGYADNGVNWQLAFRRRESGWDFDRGVVSMGVDEIAAAPTRGLHLRGNTGTVRLEDWLNLSRSGDRETGAADRIRSIDLTVADLYAVGQHLEGHRVRVDRSARDWSVQIEGDMVTGSVFVPYDFGSERAMVLQMGRMHLPGSDETSDDPATLDPRKLPPITLTADDFALGERKLGAVEIRLERIASGLEAKTIRTTDDSFEIVASGSWIADPADALGSRTSISATLKSNDVMRTMSRLNFAPGIASEEMTANVDVSWSGGPREDFLDVLDGDVRVRFGSGQLEEVEPGAGRVFGLMSIVALPRRLSFDFRDVFSKGFGFDTIAGSFRIVDGEAFTCDLSLDGPAADIGIVGRAGLANRDYDQTAVVSANVGNTLPIVGAVVAGPQVAAVLLVFSQIFKKPLQEVGQFYYGIGGSWDEPVVDSTDVADFARHGVLAGCVPDVE